VLAALIVAWCKGDRAAVPLYPEVLPALVVETLFTFALAFVVLSVATTKKAVGNSYFAWPSAAPSWPARTRPQHLRRGL